MQQQTVQWQDDTLRTNEQGHVEGSAHVFGFIEGYDITISVTSYDYKRRGEMCTNHVPHVTVTTVDGTIVAEPHTHDSSLPQKAINEARNTAQYVIENPSEFID